jgi:hypothetical protein
MEHGHTSGGAICWIHEGCSVSDIQGCDVCDAISLFMYAVFADGHTAHSTIVDKIFCVTNRRNEHRHYIYAQQEFLAYLNRFLTNYSSCAQLI